MEFVVDWQNASAATNLPDQSQCRRWLEAASVHLAEDLSAIDSTQPIDITLRFVSSDEIAELNATYREKEGPTNVLSFPFEVPSGVPMNLLGDLVLCPEVVAREAAEQHKREAHHWAHMIIHGFLHLWGYDHIKDADAEAMETLEVTILAELDIADPYV